jgi:hypothetical protein
MAKSPMKAMRASRKAQGTRKPKSPPFVSLKDMRAAKGKQSPMKARRASKLDKAMSLKAVKAEEGTSEEEEDEDKPVDEETKAKVLARIEILQKQRQAELAAASGSSSASDRKARDLKQLQRMQATLKSNADAEKALDDACPGFQAYRQKRTLKKEDSTDSLGPSASVTETSLVPFQKEMSLDTKMNLFKKGSLDEESFSKEDLHKISGKFAHARTRSPVLEETYNAAVNSEGKIDRKKARFCMLTWLKKPHDLAACISSISALTGTEGGYKEMPWLSTKQLEDMFGKEEAEEMIEDGLVASRANPMNMKRLQYQVVQEKTYAEVKKQKTIESSQVSKVTGKAAKALEDSFNACKITTSMLATAAFDCGLDLKTAMKDESFLNMLSDTQELKALQDVQDDGLASGSMQTFNYDSVKLEVLKQQQQDAEKAKLEKTVKREQMLAKTAAKNATLGLEALANCEVGAKDAPAEDLHSMMKEVLTQGHKLVANASILKPKVTKDKYAASFIKDFRMTAQALTSSYEAMLNTQGLFQAQKCGHKFVLKAVSSLGKISLKMKALIKDTSA